MASSALGASETRRTEELFVLVEIIGNIYGHDPSSSKGDTNTMNSI